MDELARAPRRRRFARAARTRASLRGYGSASEELWLLKPMTYMNHSGGPVRSVASFYKVPGESILVALRRARFPAGVVRLKQGGGAAGHNGMRDVIAQMGDGFWRLRIGVGHPGDRAPGARLRARHGRSPRTTADLEAARCRGGRRAGAARRRARRRAMNRLHTRDRYAGRVDLEVSIRTWPSAAASSGLPNVGKSTLFNALTRGADRGRELSVLHDRSERRRRAGARSAPGRSSRRSCKPEKIVPTTVEFVDIAGLVAGASQGRGARQPVPRAHPRGRRDRARRALLRETTTSCTWRARSIRSPTSRPSTPSSRWRTCDRGQGARPRGEGGARAATRMRIRRAYAVRDASRRSWMPAQPVRGDEADEEERRDLRELQLLTAKPVMYVANVAEDGVHATIRCSTRASSSAPPPRAPWSCRSARRSRPRSRSSTRPSGPSSSAELGLEEPGLNRVIRGAYRLLGPADVLHRRAEGSARLDGARGATAPQAAGVIHTDFERGFIRAEVIAFDDYIAGHGEAGRARSREAAARRQGVRRPGRRRDAFPLQRLSRPGGTAPELMRLRVRFANAPRQETPHEPLSYP